MGGRGSCRAAFPPGPAKALPPQELISFAFLSDRQRKALGGVGGQAVGGSDSQLVGAAGGGARPGSARESGGPVAVVHERHAAGQGARLGQRRNRKPEGCHYECARRAHREGGAVGAGDERRGSSLDVERKWGKSSALRAAERD